MKKALIVLLFCAPIFSAEFPDAEFKNGEAALYMARTLILEIEWFNGTAKTTEEAREKIAKICLLIQPQTGYGQGVGDKYEKERAILNRLVARLGWEAQAYPQWKKSILGLIDEYKRMKSKLLFVSPEVKKLFDEADASIATIDAPAGPEAKPTGRQRTPADAKDKPTGAKVKPLYIVELNDGTKIECLSLMDVNGELTVKTTAGETRKISAADVKAKTPVR